MRSASRGASRGFDPEASGLDRGPPLSRAFGVVLVLLLVIITSVVSHNPAEERGKGGASRQPTACADQL